MSTYVATVLEAFKREGPIGRQFPGYIPRSQQVAMARVVAQTLEKDKIAIIEAATGTGKSFAAAVPALLSGVQTVISTANIVLQDQYAFKDLPFLLRALALDLAVCEIKGKSNYLCRRRLESLRTKNPALHNEITRDVISGDLSTAPAQCMARKYAAGDTCLGKRCDHYHTDCFYYRQRRHALTSDVIVTNHAYLCQHLMRPDAGLLPDMSAQLIVDEAHQLEQYAMGLFRHEVAPRYFADGVLGQHRQQVRSLIYELTHGASPKLKDVLIPKGLESATGKDLASLLMEDVTERENDAAMLYDPEAVAFTRHLERLATNISRVSRPTPPGMVRHGIIDNHGERAVVLEPTNARVFLNDLPRAFKSVIYTSATLTSHAGFDYSLRQLGLLGVDEPPYVTMLQVESPFDYASQCCIYLPMEKGMPDPNKEYDLFYKAVAYYWRHLVEITQGGALLLFTSNAAMERVGRWMVRNLNLPVKVQGDDSRASLVDWLRNQGNAVLCATSSFWEGIDVQGQSLRLVGMDRIPMSVPSPVQTAKQAEVPNGFMNVAVPEATIRLKQGFGRLIRSTADYGIVALMDPRLWSKGWGKLIFKALPDATVATNLEDVADFYRHKAGQNWTKTSAQPSEVAAQ